MVGSIILCDDDIHILKAAEFKFKRAGYEVRCAGDGEEAWELIQQKKPDILITDYQMPRLDGIGLAERVHHDPSTNDLPVLMLSAKGFELSRDELAEKYGISHLVTKPFSPRRLLEKVQETLTNTISS